MRSKKQFFAPTGRDNHALVIKNQEVTVEAEKICRLSGALPSNSCLATLWRRGNSFGPFPGVPLPSPLADLSRHVVAKMLLPVAAEIAGAGLEILRATLGGGFDGFLLSLFQVLEIGLAVPASDGFDMKTDIVRLVAIHRTQDIATQLITRRTAGAVPPPDLTQRVNAGISSSAYFGQSTSHFRLTAQGHFDACHLFGRQGFVQKCF